MEGERAGMSQDSPLPSSINLIVPCDAEDIEYLIYRQTQAHIDTGTKSRLEIIAQSILKEARLAELMEKQAEEKK